MLIKLAPSFELYGTHFRLQKINYICQKAPKKSENVISFPISSPNSEFQWLFLFPRVKNNEIKIKLKSNFVIDLTSKINNTHTNSKTRHKREKKEKSTDQNVIITNTKKET